MLGPGLHGDSDLDLAVAGLPPAELLEAISQAEDCAAAALAGADPGGGGGAELMAADPAMLRRLRDLATDLTLERRRLEALIDSLTLLAERWQRQGADGERVDAAALRLQSLYTGIERSLLLIVRTLNGGTPEGPDWHRRQLDRLTLATERRPAVLSTDSARALGLLLAWLTDTNLRSIATEWVSGH